MDAANDDDSLLVDCVRAMLGEGRQDWQVRPDGFWCFVQPSENRSRTQGWKLHLSATPLSAPVVLARAAAVLLAHGCSFKFARTLEHVGELGSRRADRGGGGKFLTVYPDTDDDGLRALAEQLHEATRGLPGPGIMSDRRYKPGSLVHYRFGVFRGVPMLSNDGCYEAMLVAPDGSMVLDQRKAWYSPPAWAPRDPFGGDRAAKPAAPRPVLLNDRYVVNEVIRHSFGGGVYRAEDQHTGDPVVVKQARAHAGANLTGADVRTARRHEATMMRRLSGTGLTARLVETFEQQGDLFLVQELVTGATLRQWATQNCVLDDGATWGPPPAVVDRLADGLLDLVDAVHREGLVLRDLNPNNVMVTDDVDLRLIDLELVTPVGEPATRAFTPGYAAPEQVGAPPLDAEHDPSVDLYSLGATLFHLVTGSDPLFPGDEPPAREHRTRVAALLRLLGERNPCARRYAPVVVALLHDDPAQRPGVNDVRSMLAARSPVGVAPRVVTAADGEPVRWIKDGIGFLLATRTPERDRLWQSGEVGSRTDPLNVQHGAAGILAVLLRASRHLSDDVSLREAAATTARWIGSRALREPRTLPGLYFGRAGTAWALLEAGRQLDDHGVFELGTDLAGRLPLRWPNPDVCHGMAGCGFTLLRAYEITGVPVFLERARQVAAGLLAMADDRDDRLVWPIPADFSSTLAGLVHYGFAHGVAGVGAYLLTVACATGDRSFLDAAERGGRTLAAAAQVKDGAAYWPSGQTKQVGMTSWCSGASGVGTFLLRLGARTGDERFTELALQAATAVYRSRWHAGPAQCHGLAGDGEFLLDVADVTGDDTYRDRARDLAVSIYGRHALRDGRMLAPDELLDAVTADYNTGLAGVVAFLLRLEFGGDRMWLPASYTAIGMER
ncbi:class IV lanthionine synthetase LanL [Actinoplanes sp. NPDC049681]|uniref:class IV lanthionine synthetase LanL n=1 Tax=Actinoplanes sp. NPDC049681 TaxID=3363905 RepID=UPI00378C6F6E